MPGAPQREAILGIVIRQHAAEVGTAQVNPQLLANEPAAPGNMRPLQLIAGACARGPFRTWRDAHPPLTLCLAVSAQLKRPLTSTVCNMPECSMLIRLKEHSSCLQRRPAA